MTLPFVKDDGKRKWACFCCGHQFTSFDHFKSHIVENHEEGRDYLICPLVRCAAPVRDLVTHFRAKHPQDQLPKMNGQIKATIWKDPSKNGTMKTRKKFRKGGMISNKNGGKEIKYKSGWECEVYERLEVWDEVVGYKAEPFAIKYSFDGEVHDYLPDLLVHFTDGHTELWEIKPGNQTHLPRNIAKWHSAKYHCETRGWKFLVITEIGIEKLKKGLPLD